MMTLEQLTPGTSVRGIRPDSIVTVETVTWYGQNALSLVYRDTAGKIDNEVLYREDEARLDAVELGRPWSFDGDGAKFRLVAEANRIRLAHLFDPILAVHTSLVEPLPHQITAVYESMLPRQPLRFLLADDPGAGKTIMAGLLIKELIARGDLKRCLIICPGSLAEQWQDELSTKFLLPFKILTNDSMEASPSGNWFADNDLCIARLDKLARNEDVVQKILAVESGFDLVVCDEAHKLSATFFGGEVKYTKRYKMAQQVARVARHFLLMTATPHNGKDADFQLFLALLDGDRFEGKFRDGVHQVDVSDLMRRMVKENLRKFDGKPLFPERIAYTVPYKLSDEEAALYAEVTEYVRQEFNRADALENDKRAGTVGFALTILQRRLASSPQAIYQSLVRRHKRLEQRLGEVKLVSRGAKIAEALQGQILLDADDIEDLEDAPESEVEAKEEEVLDQATAAGTIEELKAEIFTLQRLEQLAERVMRNGSDTKWSELSNLLHEIFTPGAFATAVHEPESTSFNRSPIPKPESGPKQKLVIFTEHRDTLNYLRDKIANLIGTEDSISIIHGGVGREDRKRAQDAFLYNPDVRILLATDAAGEGINLQRAHLMVNYDLPWNPNRLEQRFGRIHRIGQTEVCHLWNLVAEETREGDVYRKLLEKLEEARTALGGQVFDVLGKLQFDGKPLRDLMIEAIRYGDLPEVRQRLDLAVECATDKEHVRSLLDDNALAKDSMDTTRVAKVREEMERAEAARLQPHFVESFFMEAFRQLGGAIKERESRRFEITNVPAAIRNRDRQIGQGDAVQPRYERVVFEKQFISPPGKPMGAFICPGHPLLDAVLDLTMERNRDLLKRGAILIDDRDPGVGPRVMFFLEHAIQDASVLPSGERRTISKRLLYVEMNERGDVKHLNYAPYLDYRPLKSDEPSVDELFKRDDLNWITHGLEKRALEYAIGDVVPTHIKDVRDRRMSLIEKTRAAVQDRLTKEIMYWDHRSNVLLEKERAGKGDRLNSGEARRRADELQTRLRNRLHELSKESQISAVPPVVLGGIVVLPAGYMAVLKGKSNPNTHAIDTQISATKARAVVMEMERSLGFDPVDRELDKLGYDIESRIRDTGKLRFIEVKGRVANADTVTVTRNEIQYSLNKPDDFILAMVSFHADQSTTVKYLRNPFRREPDFGVTSVNYNFAELLARAEDPR